MKKTDNTRPSYVLVHGAWHGGWCWKKVKALLEAKGYSVFTPTLTGLGERSHLLTRQVNLTTHIDDIVLMLEYEGLTDAILVGHSYAGMVISGVAERVASRISHLVYFDAYLPENNKSINDYLKVPLLKELVETKGEGWKMPFPGKIESLGVTAPEDIEWVTPRIGYQPYSTFTENIKLTSPSNTISKTFIRLSEFPWFVAAAERALQQGFNYHEMLSGGHDAMISRPEETAEILSQIGENN